MNCNYHTHTTRCGHAIGPDRAYVETAIARGLKTLGFSERATVLNLDFTAAIDRLLKEGAAFDLAFLDPPYREGLSEHAVRLLFEKRLVKSGGLVILEHAAEFSPQGLTGVYRINRTKRFGKCAYSLIEEDEA